jgi:hypothetical protein
MDDQDVLSRISSLVAEERALRARSSGGHALEGTELERLHSVETNLDQCWDLLRQRRAREEFGEDPDAARSRPAGDVENYLQ